MRRRLHREAKEENFEENLVKSIVLVAREMSWTLDYTLNLSPAQFMMVSEAIGNFYEEQNRAMKSKQQALTFRR